MNKYSIAFIFILCIGIASAYETVLDDRGLNTTGNVTADWFKGKINYSDVQNAPSVSGDNSSWNQSLADQLYNFTAGANLTLTNKVFALNGTSVLEWLDTLFPRATSVWSAILGNWTDLESRKLNITDQRYNETSYVNSNFIGIGENSTIARAGTSTALCSGGQVAQNITIVTNRTGVFVTSWQCTTIAGSANFTNVAYLNNSQTFTLVNTFATDTGKVRIGDNAGIADILNIYADSSSGNIIFDNTEMSSTNTIVFEPQGTFQDRILVAQTLDYYSKFGGDTVSAVTISDTADRLVTIKKPTSITTANRALVASCEVGASGSSSAGACMGGNSYAGIPSGINWNSTVTNQGGGLRPQRNVIFSAGSGNVAKASAYTGQLSLTGSGSNFSNVAMFNAEAPSLSAGTQSTNLSGLRIEGGTPTGVSIGYAGIRIADLSGLGAGRYAILQEGTTDPNRFNSNVTINNQLFVTNNVTADWFKGKINYSDVQNAPSVSGDNSSWNQSLADQLYNFTAGANLTLTNKVFALNGTSVLEWLDTLFPRATSVWSAISGNFTQLSNTKADKTEVCWDVPWGDTSTAPSGYYLYETSTVTAVAGYMVTENVYVNYTAVWSTATINCIGTDATTNNSCKVEWRYNQSGSLINPYNITLVNSNYGMNYDKINLSFGDQILPFGYGSVSGNTSSVTMTNTKMKVNLCKR